MIELVGQTLGQYRIVEQIGEGGMATVYKSYQPGLDRYVAIKVLPPIHARQPGFSERFQREAKAIASLHHQNILPVYDFGQEGDYSFLVMRYIEGAYTLKDLMMTGLELSQAAEIIGQIAGALDHAHQRGIIHRDVKPGNVLMDGDWSLLTDFGLAKMTEASVQLTGSGVGVGTPAYMSPEQGQGAAIDHRSDVYSLGIVLFEMLTGQIPHNAETPFAIVLKRVTEPLPMPRSINPDIPEAVERVLLKTLARAPEDRFASAGEMAAALKLAASAPATALDTIPMSIATEWTGEPASPNVESPTPVPEATAPPVETTPKEPVIAAPARAGRTFPWPWVAGIVAVVVIAALLVWGVSTGWWDNTKSAAVTPTVAAVMPTQTATPGKTVTEAAINTPTAAIDTPTPGSLSGRAYYEQGLQLMNQGKNQEAIEQFDLALGQGYKSAALYYNRGLACHSLQSFQGGCDCPQAIDDYTKAIELDSENASYYEARAWAYVCLYDYERAVADYSRAIEFDPQNARYYQLRGDRYSELEDYQAASADYDKAIELDPEHAETYRGRASIYEQQGQYAEALADLTKRIELEPDAPWSFWDRAAYYARQDMIDKARADYETGLALSEGKEGYDSARADAQAWIAADPLVYDDFSDLAYEGGYDPALWMQEWDPNPGNQVGQENGVMRFGKQGVEYQTDLTSKAYAAFPIDRPTFFETRLMLSPGSNTGNVNLDLRTQEGWYAQCMIFSPAEQAEVMCFEVRGPDDVAIYGTAQIPVEMDTWYTLRIEVDPTATTFTYFLDGRQIGSHTPFSAEQLKQAEFALRIGVFSESPDDPVTGYVDDVRVGPVAAAVVPTESLPAEQVWPREDVPRNRTLIIESVRDFSAAGAVGPYATDYSHQSGDAAQLEGLFYYSAFADEMIPWLAEGYEYNDDATELTVTIRKGVEWSDGEPFTARDVAFTINMIIRHNLQWNMRTSASRCIQEVQALDDYTVRFVLTEPNWRFHFTYLTFNFDRGLYIVPEHIYRDVADPAQFVFFDLDKGWPVVTGPYQLVEFTDQHKYYDLRYDWWAAKIGLAEMPRVERVIVLPPVDDEQTTQMIVDNELDIGADIFPAAIKNAVAQADYITTYTGREPPYGNVDWWPTSLYFNTLEKPYDDSRVRWAVAYAIDQQAVVDEGWLRSGDVADLPYPSFPPLLAYRDGIQDLLEQHNVLVHDLDKVASLMTEAGFSRDGEGFWVDAQGNRPNADLYAAAEYFGDIAPIIVEQLRAAGFDAEYVSPPDVWAAKQDGRALMFLYGHGGSIVDPYTTLEMYHSDYIRPTGETSGGLNMGRWGNTEFDAIVEQMGALPASDPKNEALFHQAMAIWLEELPEVPVVQWFHRIPMNTTYWTNWPMADNPYINPTTWHLTFLLMLRKLEPVQ